jgi:alkylhydroperoxidase family enzyme
LDDPVRRLLEYVEKLTLVVADVSEEDVAALRACGWSDRAIHDAVQIASYFNYINRVADALGVDPEPDLPGWGRA